MMITLIEQITIVNRLDAFNYFHTPRLIKIDLETPSIEISFWKCVIESRIGQMVSALTFDPNVVSLKPDHVVVY